MNERIRELRKSLGLTLEKFGEPIGVKKSTLSSLENGSSGITTQMIKSICLKYNVNEEWLINGTGDMFTEIDRDDQLMRWAASVLKDDSDSFRKRFVTMLSSLSVDEWQFLENKARMLIDLRDQSDEG